MLFNKRAQEGVTMAILGIVAVIAVVGLVLLFAKGPATGQQAGPPRCEQVCEGPMEGECVLCRFTPTVRIPPQQCSIGPNTVFMTGIPPCV